MGHEPTVHVHHTVIDKHENIPLILSFRRVLYVICFLLGNSLASVFQ